MFSQEGEKIYRLKKNLMTKRHNEKNGPQLGRADILPWIARLGGTPSKPVELPAKALDF